MLDGGESLQDKQLQAVGSDTPATAESCFALVAMNPPISRRRHRFEHHQVLLRSKDSDWQPVHAAHLIHSTVAESKVLIQRRVPIGATRALRTRMYWLSCDKVKFEARTMSPPAK